MLLALGCGGEPASEGDDAPRPDVTPDLPGPPPRPPVPADDDLSAEAAGQPAAKPAAVGVGRKGRGYGTGPIATPLAARWSAAERLAFDALIPKALSLFQATHNRPPASHDEFMTEIIRENQIDLPELPEGQRYQYDPDRAELMVVPDGP